MYYDRDYGSCHVSDDGYVDGFGDSYLTVTNMVTSSYGYSDCCGDNYGDGEPGENTSYESNIMFDANVSHVLPWAWHGQKSMSFSPPNQSHQCFTFTAKYHINQNVLAHYIVSWFVSLLSITSMK